MKIMVLDTSMEMATVGIANSDSVLSQNRILLERGATSTVHSQIEKVFADCNLTPRDIELIGVVVGPGSFSGLRVSLSAVKGLAHPFSIPIVGIKSTLALAAMIPNCRFVAVIINARRSQFLCSIYENTSTSIKEISAPVFTTMQRVLDDVPKEAILTGQGLNYIEKEMLSDYAIAPQELWFPSVLILARLAGEIHSRGEHLDLKTAVPIYFREVDALIK